jgi:hypothetical protein
MIKTLWIGPNDVLGDGLLVVCVQTNDNGGSLNGWKMLIKNLILFEESGDFWGITSNFK